MKLRRAVPAGVVDAACASLATLGVGLYAAGTLSPVQFGSYALFFTGFALATAIPTQLVLAPAEFSAIATTPRDSERLGLVRHSLRLGTPFAAASGLVVALAATAAAQTEPSVLRALAITTIACSVVSPLQDHIRRVLHLGGSSCCAATVSGVQVLVVAGGLAGLTGVGVAPPWRPLGALTAANAVSLGVGLALARRRAGGARLPRVPLRRLVDSGRWLLGAEFAVTGASFLSAAIVSRLVSPEALGRTEAARIVAAPIFMLTLGLTLVLGPRSVEAAAGGQERRADRIARLFTALLAAGALLYGLITALPWAGNPLARLLPQAYVQPGLVSVSVLAYLLLGLPFPARAELIGSGRERRLPGAAAAAGMLQCLVTLAFLPAGAFTRPIGVGIFGLVAAGGYRRHRRAIYAGDPMPDGGAINSDRPGSSEWQASAAAGAGRPSKSTPRC